MMKCLVILSALILVLSGCDPQADPDIDNPSRGSINISVDESFRPVIEEQLAMYKTTYPETEIIAHYKSEADCLKDLFRDSATRLVIVTRGLSDNEEKFFRDSLNYIPSWNRLAHDAIVVLVNSESTDSLFTMERLRSLISGEEKDKKIVFDGLNATSTFRFIHDSILKGRAMDTSVVKAAINSQAVIDYISADTNAIGFVGISWIGNPEVAEQVKMLNKVKISYIRCEFCEGQPYVKPDQASILSRRYPLVRGLYYVLKENYTGLGTGFINFLKNERGQLIFRRSYLGPTMDLNIRNVKINIQ